MDNLCVNLLLIVEIDLLILLHIVPLILSVVWQVKMGQLDVVKKAICLVQVYFGKIELGNAVVKLVF